MTDASITVASIVNMVKLVERVRQSDDPDARELAARVAEAIGQPGRRVGAALMPKKRGGVSEWQADKALDRAVGYRKFAMAKYGTTSLTPSQVRRLNRNMERLLKDVRFMESGDGIEQEAIRQIRAAGGPVSVRHALRILPEKKL